MRAVDSNVLVRLLARDDPTQVDLAERFVASGGWVSLLALAECVWVLKAIYRLDPAQLASAIALCLSHATLSLQDADVVESALASFRARPKLGFADCLMIEIARKTGHLPLGTFDRDLDELDGAEMI